jgi:methyl-accepting chemotaxis protein
MSEKKEKSLAGAKRKTIIFKYIAILFLLFALLFTVLNVLTARTVKKDSADTYKDFSMIVAQKSASTLSYWIAGLYKELRVYTDNDIFLSGDAGTITSWIVANKHLLGDDFYYVGLAGPDGILHTSTGANTDIHDRDYFKAIVQDGKKQYIDNPVLSRTTNTYVFHVCVPALDRNGRQFGLFCGVVSIDNLQKEISAIKVGKAGYAYALASDGTTIAHPDEKMLMQNLYKDGKESMEQTGFSGLYDITTHMISGETGEGFAKGIKTHDVLYMSYTPIPLTPWSLGLTIPQTQIYESAMHTAQFTTISAVLIALLILAGSGIYLYILLRPLIGLKDSVSEIASGDADLTKKIEVRSHDEIGEVVTGFNTFTEKLRTIISRVKDAKEQLQSVDAKMHETIEQTSSSITQIIANIQSVTGQITNQSASVEETAGAVTQIAQNIESLNHLIENQSSGVSQASAAVEEMIGNITSITKSMDHMADTFELLEKYTQSGVAKQNAVNERIIQIESQSKMLFDANKAISEIASQTNLLAMNAAIEAAHAGDAGRGFSVVSDEIRKLSETSTAQSKTIGSELQKIQESITSVVAASMEAQQSFNSVSKSINETDELVRQIKAAMSESQEGSKQITDALSMMNDSTIQVRTASTEMSAGNQAILEEVRRLQDVTMQMKDSVGEMSQGAQGINESGATLTDMSRMMEDSIKNIGSEIDLFKV